MPTNCSHIQSDQMKQKLNRFQKLCMLSFCNKDSFVTHFQPPIKTYFQLANTRNCIKILVKNLTLEFGLNLPKHQVQQRLTAKLR